MKIFSQAVRLTHCLVKFGYFSAQCMVVILPRVISLLDENQDIRFRGATLTEKEHSLVSIIMVERNTYAAMIVYSKGHGTASR